MFSPDLLIRLLFTLNRALDAAPQLGLGRKLFGRVQWQPPAWWIGTWQWLGRRRIPWRGLLTALAGLGLLLAWLLLHKAPPPANAVSWAIEAPAATDYQQNPPVVSPLTLLFSASVAPLAAIGAQDDAGGAQASAAILGVSLRPALDGRWAWLDDRQLRFTPAQDWPVAQRYSLELDPAAALRPDTLLANREASFETAPFGFSIDSAEFYQDPENAQLKRGNWALSFSHPVDSERLRSRLKLKAVDPQGRSLPTPELSLRVADDRLQAWVQTTALQLPEHGGRLQLQVERGVRSSLNGPGEADAQSADVVLPSLNSVTVEQIDSLLVDNAQHQPEQLLSLQFNEAMRDRDVRDALELYLLPERRQPTPGEEEQARHWPVPYGWQLHEVGEALLAQSIRLAPEPMPGEREWSNQHLFRYQADPGRVLYVRVKSGLRSFGGFRLGQGVSQLLSVPPYPAMLSFVGNGALLSLAGERRLSVMARNQPHARLEIGRVLPSQLVQMVSGNDGSFGTPAFWRIDEDALVERFEHTLEFASDSPARAEYQGVDLGAYFSPSRRGVFLLDLRSLDADEARLSPQQRLATQAGSSEDRRLVVLTDLGLIAKQELGGTRRVFVLSLAGQGALAGVRVQVLGRNGETLVEARTGSDGSASLPALDGFVREREPVVIVATLGDDMSFLPLGDWSRQLDLSRFDVGGDIEPLDPGSLQAVLFSDRGLYRPGETVHLGLIVRARDWSRPLAGLPLELVVSDPTGRVAHRQALSFGAAGFEEAAFTPDESAPTGSWEAQLYVLGGDLQRRLIGATTVQLRDFAPDTLRVRATLPATAGGGWIHPAALDAKVHVENLFGTPAQQRRVSAQLQLRPVLPSFANWPGFRFHDLRHAGEGLVQTLGDSRTDANGDAALSLGLEQIEGASYQLQLLVRAFEAGSGRGVAATASALVSDRRHMVGLRSNDSLDYVSRNAKRDIELVVIGPDTQPIAPTGLRTVWLQRRMVSVLTQGHDGLYRYVSRERRDVLADRPLAAVGGVQRLSLDTAEPGDFVLEIRDEQDQLLNSMGWTVAGDANLSRSLERNAELDLRLSKPSYAAGEELELSIRAPYAGSGLITIERDKVYASQSFHSSTTSSVQRIRIPDGLEGNAYVSVQFLRDPASPEVLMSPLSHGVLPFAIDRSARTLGLSLSAPARGRPGELLRLQLRSDAPARVAVFAVDEGILQVAGYRVGHPLDQLLRKRMLQVESQQILDLLLPEFSRMMNLSTAPGGDGEGDAARHLNPFKRRGEPPAVWWSGLLDIDGERQLEFTPPDSFNGELRLVAVAVSPSRMGLAETRASIRGDFVISPTLPTSVAPGDRFEVPIGLANTLDGAASASAIQLQLELSPQLKLDSEPPAPLELAPGAEGVVRVRLVAGDAPGVASVGLRASDGTHQATRRIELSIRPALPRRSTLRFGSTDRTLAIDDLRDMFDERALRRFSAAASPLVVVGGLSQWLADYPHPCTEQLTSAAIAELVRASHPDLTGSTEVAQLPAILDQLRGRQNAEGGFGYWTATADVDAFVAAYVGLLLVEARERGHRVADDLLSLANDGLQRSAADSASSELPTLRARALGIYLLIRQGRTESNLLAALQAQLERDHPKQWKNDLSGVLVAASYQLLKQQRPARELALLAVEAANRGSDGGDDDLYSPLAAQAWRLYLLRRHFPELGERLQPSASAALITALREGRYNTLSAAMALLALDAEAPAAAPAPLLQWESASAQQMAFGAVQGSLRSGSVDRAARRLWVLPEAEQTVWYLLSESGFDRQPGAPIQHPGLDIQRDYLDADGRPTTTVVQGEELVVRLRLRGDGWHHLALIDLLPGGFETVLSPPPAVAPAADDSEDCMEEDCEAADDPADSGTPAAPAVLALPESTLLPEHIELREDRVLLYTHASPEMQEFRYRIRAGSVGSFVIPPPYVEHMYRPEIVSRGGEAGRLTVSAPPR